MKAKGTKKPTESELSILKILWENGPSTVRTVHETLNRGDRGKKIGYTTALKMMQLMYEKGILSRNEENRSHVYAALIQQQDTQKLLLGNLVDKVFGGSASKLVLQALGGYDASKEELSEIRKVLDQMERKK